MSTLDIICKKQPKFTFNGFVFFLLKTTQRWDNEKDSRESRRQFSLNYELGSHKESINPDVSIGNILYGEIRCELLKETFAQKRALGLAINTESISKNQISGTSA